MKTHTKLISAVLLILFVSTSIITEAKHVPDRKNRMCNSNSETLQKQEFVQHSEILSPKNYNYEMDYLQNKKEFVIFLFDQNAKLTISVDENGNIHEDIEYFDDTNDTNDVEEEKEQNTTSLLDGFRKNVGILFREASEVVLNPNTNTGNKLDNTPFENKKYFKSDYETNSRI
jgi:hypothetical protein